MRVSRHSKKARVLWIRRVKETQSETWNEEIKSELLHISEVREKERGGMTRNKEIWLKAWSEEQAEVVR
jgi:hypothetical protein